MILYGWRRIRGTLKHHDFERKRGDLEGRGEGKSYPFTCRGRKKNGSGVGILISARFPLGFGFRISLNLTLLAGDITGALKNQDARRKRGDLDGRTCVYILYVHAGIERKWLRSWNFTIVAFSAINAGLGFGSGISLNLKLLVANLANIK